MVASKSVWTTMAATSTTLENRPPHLALFPSSGMGHLIPFLRLAATLSSGGCDVILITVHPTVSAAESDHLSAFLAGHRKISRLQFQLLPYQKSKFTNEDPFFIQMESINSSVHLLQPLLSSVSPPLSGIVTDFPVTSTMVHLASQLSIPLYTVITTSARFFSLVTHLPHLKLDTITKFNKDGYVQIPTLGPMAVSNIPPPMLDKNHFFSANICSNVSSLSQVKAVLINTFTWFEKEAIQALNVNGPARKIIPIGPLVGFETEPAINTPWLDQQARDSVIFVSFGSRTALSNDQTRQLAIGLEKSGCKFLWALKSSKVDKDEAAKPAELLGESFLTRTVDKGMVVKEWVDQERILAHPAIGGFLSHCGWNSVVEAARHGVPILAWPQHGDQRVNAEVVEKAGLGIWVRDWGWFGEKLVCENEIAEKIRELMVNTELRVTAKEIKKKAWEAGEVNGSSLVQCLME